MTNIRKTLALTFLAGAALALCGCGGDGGGKAPGAGGDGGAGDAVPCFSLAWSEYPSWSTFGVAHELKLVDGKKGALGPIEKKWGVDIELKEAEYDPCLQMYGAGQCDAVCITNMDVLNPSLSRKSVAVAPTSTSLGADALIATGDIKDVRALKGRNVYGLSKTVSEYLFVRNLELLGEKEADYKFTNMDPGAAALAMQQKKAGYEAIVVWNPFVLETLNKRADAKVIFDSTKIPGEIIDMLVVAEEALARPRGREFACAAVEVFYAVSARIEDPRTRDATLVALGEKFSHLKLEAMKKVVEQTRFYKTPDEGLALFKGAELPKVMEKVVDFCVKHDIVKEKPTVGYGDRAAAGAANLRFDPSFITAVKEKK